MTDHNTPRNPAEVYQAYMVPTLFQPWSEELLARVDLRPGERVLDVACGTGVVARGAAAIVGQDGAVTGVDISPDMIAVARALPAPEGAPMTWQVARAEEIPFDDESFDVVLCQQGVQFFEDRLAGLREIHRVLKPGGRLGVSIWRGPEHQAVVGALIAALQRWFGPGAGVPFSLGDEDTVRQLLLDAGFRDVSVEVVSRHVHEPSTARFLEQTIAGAAAAVPALGKVSQEDRIAAIRAIREEIADEIAAVQVGEGMEYPMESHVVIATA